MRGGSATTAGYERLLGDAKDSPIVDRRGTSWVFGGAIHDAF
jgi:outer membrane scaffolding protein for murein synthesis (MipA/OmpV family)